MSSPFELLEITVAEGVCTIEIHHQHEACVMTDQLSDELRRAVFEYEPKADVRVIVFRSSDPDFFIAHRDVTSIIGWAKEGGGERFGAARVEAAERGDADALPPSYRELLRKSNKVSIVEMAGRAGGGGNELAAACDMRFGLIGKTKINQMEVPLGILPGGNGTVNLRE